MSKKKRRKQKEKKQKVELESKLGIKLSKGKRKELKSFALKLQKNKPKSEIWFENQCKHSNMPIHKFKSNEPFLGYIPDYRCDQYKIIIEIDGNYHDIKEVKQKDIIKSDLYKKAGYTVIRIKAYNDNSLLKGFQKLKEILNS